MLQLPQERIVRIAQLPKPGIRHQIEHPLEKINQWISSHREHLSPDRKSSRRVAGNGNDHWLDRSYSDDLSGEAESEVNISFTNNHIVFEFDDTIVVSRLIEGEYFRIDQMLSSDYETKIQINKKEFLDCIDRATLFVKESDKKPIIINIENESMQLNINTQIGSMKEDIDIEKEGKDIMIGFNPKFLIDALKVIDDEKVTIYLVNPKAPCFIKDEKESYIYLILPVNFNSMR